MWFTGALLLVEFYWNLQKHSEFDVLVFAEAEMADCSISCQL